ncbi:MAG: class I SAM-dependent methyltransferase [Nitrospirae bacterium]|nr:class I SAM-dependent methyltransferase [Nitrospirota bacterium]
MADFNDSHWSKPEFSSNYVDNADNFIVQRSMMYNVMMSYYRYFIIGVSYNSQAAKARAILDLGCGDGILTHMLLSIDNNASATLADGSNDMLEKARTRMKEFNNVKFLNASFQEVIKDDLLPREFDFVVSSLAIHHLNMAEKASLFASIYNSLKIGGHFLNIDVVIAPCAAIEEWYMTLWKEWNHHRQVSLGMPTSYEHIPALYKSLS